MYCMLTVCIMFPAAVARGDWCVSLTPCMYVAPFRPACCANHEANFRYTSTKIPARTFLILSTYAQKDAPAKTIAMPDSSSRGGGVQGRGEREAKQQCLWGGRIQLIICATSVRLFCLRFGGLPPWGEWAAGTYHYGTTIYRRRLAL